MVAWSVDARIAHNMCHRFTQQRGMLKTELQILIKSSPIDIISVDRCIPMFISSANENDLRVPLVKFY